MNAANTYWPDRERSPEIWNTGILRLPPSRMLLDDLMIVRLYYEKEATDIEIAESYGITRARVYQRRLRGLQYILTLSGWTRPHGDVRRFKQPHKKANADTREQWRSLVREVVDMVDNAESHILSKIPLEQC